MVNFITFLDLMNGDAQMNLSVLLSDERHDVELADAKKMVRSFKRVGVSNQVIKKEVKAEYSRLSQEELEDIFNECHLD
ncbi:hypothetical protein [Lactobacillus xujianguonis]|uniref:hypothetical protein n=1 Tax=Lactobacillus xujianguonis TaxID=2495899 RepID=UPI000FD84787|nr:hypothetical protein [Lactobacillus xujianguonis]RVU72077.1 hypothetical protein EJK20_10890 [Lactobacillus xujianguonis]